MFTQLADERARALSDLQAETARLGGTADSDGSTLGHLHQRWLDLKASITGRDDKAVVNEVERGEDYLKEKFEAALNTESLDAAVRAPIEHEVRYWTQALGVTEERLRQLVKDHGNSATAVRTALGTPPGETASA